MTKRTEPDTPRRKAVDAAYALSKEGRAARRLAESVDELTPEEAAKRVKQGQALREKTLRESGSKWTGRR